jgi:hypothetical protein
LLIAVILLSVILTVDFGGSQPKKKQVYFGVDCAYGDINSLKALVDEVKNYTNVFVFGLPECLNRTLLDESCDFIYNSGLNFIVQFTNTTYYNATGGWTSNNMPAQWVSAAEQKYGDKFLAVYRWDEAGGDQIDRSKYQEVLQAQNLSDAANQYAGVLNEPIQYYKNENQLVLTADYSLYWFEYKAGYDAVLAEFGWNNSRDLQIALCRGAARAYNRDWGVMVTWDNYGPTYIENASALYSDLLLAYNNGAKYEIVFDYPATDTSAYGILTAGHLEALQKFWTYIQNNQPTDANYAQVKRAYVLPADFGFGFRSKYDTIWGLWASNYTAQKIWDDTQALISQYGANFDIVCDGNIFNSGSKNSYSQLFYWSDSQSTG